MSRRHAPLVLITESACPELQTALEAEGWRITYLDLFAPSESGAVQGILHISGRPLTQEFLEKFNSLQAISIVGDPANIIPEHIPKTNGIKIYSVKQHDADDAAEHALSLIYTAGLQLQEGQWVERDAAWMEAHSLRGRRVGVVGLGTVGAAFARRASALGMEVSWWGPRSKSAPWSRSESLMALAERSDILVISCPNDPATRRLINEAVLQALGSRGLLVSLAGREVIDETALVDALQAQRLSAAALNLTDEDRQTVARLRHVPNLILTSPPASLTLEFMVESAALAIRHVQEHFAIFGGLPSDVAQKPLQLDALKRAFLARARATESTTTTRH